MKTVDNVKNLFDLFWCYIEEITDMLIESMVSVPFLGRFETMELCNPQNKVFIINIFDNLPLDCARQGY